MLNIFLKVKNSTGLLPLQKEKITQSVFILMILGLSFVGFLSFVILFGFILNPLMKVIFDSVVYPIFATTITLLFTGILLFRAKSKDIDFIQLRFLVLFSSFIALFNLLQVFDWNTAKSNVPFERPEGHSILNIADLCICIAALMLYFHFESLISYHPSLIRIIFVFLMIFPISLLNLVLIFHQVGWLFEAVSFLSKFVALGIIFIVIFSILTVSKIYTLHSDSRTRIGAILTAGSIMNLGIAFASQKLIPDDLDFILFTANIYQLMLFSISVSLLGIGYIIDPYLIYSNPFELEALLIYDEYGLPVYHFNFTKSQQDMTESSLQSGALSSVNILMKEISNYRGNLTGINLADGILLFSHATKVTVCIFSESQSYSLQTSLNRFTKELDKSISEIPDDRNELKIMITTLKDRYFPQ